MPQGVLVLATVCWAATLQAQETPRDQARAILDATGVQGGLVVHVGCGDGALTSALCVSDIYLIQGLDRDPANVERARETIRAAGVGGTVSADLFDGTRLPYADNLVKLLVVEDPTSVSMDEVKRVLCPGGVAYVRKNGTFHKTVKRWPDGVDEWTHALHGPDNNSVASDTVVGPPKRLQWVGGPSWARSHDHLSSTSAVVSSGGRLFSIVDEAPAAAVALPAEWRLVAQDAFSGVVLWKRDIDPWEGHLRGFRTGPAAIQRRLVAVGDTVYVTLGYGNPVTALDAATGEIKRTYAGTEEALEILCDKGVLYVVTGPGIGHGAALGKHDQGREATYVSPGGKALVAVNASTGKTLWKKADADTGELMPTALAVSEGAVYFQNAAELVCLDANSGEGRWRVSRPVATNRYAWTAPTLVVHGGVVLSADRDASSRINEEDPDDGRVRWVVYSKGGESPPGKLMAFAAGDGKKLWETEAREVYNAPVDVFVVDGLVWTGNLVRSKEPGITKGLDPRTGEVKRTRPPDSEFYDVGMGHHRCYRNKATATYLVLGRSGVEWIDVKTGKAVMDHWVRGACQFGVLPCNGLLYVPPHSCACYIEGKLHGFLALSPTIGEAPAKPVPDEVRLLKGPAYGVLDGGSADVSEEEWPTYRRDAARTGRAASAIPAKLVRGWQTSIGAPLSSAVVANGKIFVAEPESHTVHALDASTGQPVWSKTVAARVDSPPSIYNGLCLFGCRDGYVYCLRARDGALVWRFRAAPEDRRIVAYGQLESAWPVHGSILVLNGSACFAAGRCSYLDNGIMLYRLDAATGELQAKRQLDNRDPETGREPKDIVRGVYMPGALPDILSSDGTSIFMRHRRFDMDLTDQPSDTPHLFAPAGFLDGSWWHRTYWLYGTRMQVGWGGWGKAGYRAAAGRLLAVDESDVYAFGRLNQYGTHGAHVGLPVSLHPWGDEPPGEPRYILFASSKEAQLRDAKGARRGFEKKVKPRWEHPCDLWVRAMVVADDALLVAGVPDPLRTEGASPRQFPGDQPGVLRVLSPTDGTVKTEYALPACPAYDAMAVSNGCVYVSTTDGMLVCMKGG